MISVAIPTLGRGEWVLAAARSVLESSETSDFELLVLDNACDPDLERALSDLARHEIRYIPVPDVGLHNGRHAAATEANGEVLAYLDDDVLVSRSWLGAIADSFADPSVHLVGGPCVPLFEAPPPAWVEDLWERQADGMRWCAPLSLIEGAAATREIDPTLVFGANFAIRRSTLLQVGGFHPDGVPWPLRVFRGDGETAVSRAVGKLGLKSIHNPLAAVQHRVTAERMTEEYLGRRSLLQGISDSYTDRRSGRAAARRWRVLRGVRSALRAVGRVRPKGLREKMDRAHAFGYAFHQERANADPIVDAWVHRADYWDAPLPRGTEASGPEGTE